MVEAGARGMRHNGIIGCVERTVFEGCRFLRLVAVHFGLLLVMRWRRDPGSSVLPKAIGAIFSNHLGCGGLRRCVMKACPIYSSRVSAVPRKSEQSTVTA